MNRLKSKTKLSSLIPSLYGGGAEKIACDLSIYLEDNFAQETITYNSDRTYSTFRGKRVIIDKSRSSNHLGRISSFLKLGYTLRKHYRSVKPDISISHMLIANILNILCANRNSLKVCFLHGEWSVKSGKGVLLDKVIRKIYSKADLFVSVSDHIKRMHDGYHNISVPNIVVKNGILVNDVILRSKEEIDVILPIKYIVYVAGFRPVKNHVKLIEYYKEIFQKTGYKLVLLGDGELRKKIETKIKDLGLTNEVILLGNLDNPYPIIKGASLSIVFSSSESFGLVLLEAMLLKTPVITTNCGGPVEIVKPTNSDIEFGYVVDHPDILNNTDFTNAVVNILSKDQTKLTDLAFNEALTYDMQNQSSSLISTIKTLIEERN